ncbi:MAG: structural cement protein Gp24 [Shewanella sp.]
MAVVQTNYANDLVKGYAGMIANGEEGNRISRTNEDVAGIGFGRPVYRGVGDHGCTATVGTLASFYGFTIAHEVLGLLAGQTSDTYPQFENVAILTQGAIYVAVTGAVTDGAPLSIGTGAGAGDGIGATAPDATHIATGWIADETVTNGICRIVKR